MVVYYLEESSVVCLTKRAIELFAFCVSTSDRSFNSPANTFSRLEKRIYKVYLIKSLLKILPGHVQLGRLRMTKISKCAQLRRRNSARTRSNTLCLSNYNVRM